MRDRLIELIREARKNMKSANSDLHREHLFADYLLENGVIVSPCKVGDTVYCEFNEKVIQGTVILIRPFISRDEIVFKGNIICEIDSPFYDGIKEEYELFVVFEKPYGIERVAYLTKEEAEKQLQGGVQE